MNSMTLQPVETRFKGAANHPRRGGISVGYSTLNTFVQPKLTVNQPNDIYEQEADKTANEVMAMKSPNLQTKPLAVSWLQRKCAHCEEEESVQMKDMNHREATPDSDLENYVGGLNSHGQALPDDVKSFFEPRFGHDFNGVRIHTDTVAAKSAQSINALAYTNGSNIVFNDGQYSPETENGKRLLAHELTHVVQQGGSTGISSKSRNNDSFTNNSMGEESLFKAPLLSSFTASESNQLSLEGDEAVPMGTEKSLRECINAGLSAAGIEIQIGYIAMGACGLIAVIAGIGTVEIGAIPGALAAAIACLAFTTGIEIGILTGIVVACVNNRNSY